MDLNKEQRKVLEQFIEFINNPKEKYFVLSASAGTGKSYLSKYLADEAIKLGYVTYFTATTNKAAESLSNYVEPVQTIHSLLGLRVKNNFDTGRTELVVKDFLFMPDFTVLFIDEASMINGELLDYIQRSVKNTQSKVVFIGDKYQLAPVRSRGLPIFDLPAVYTSLETVMRSCKHKEITELANDCKDVVKGEPRKPINILGQVKYEGDIIDKAIKSFRNNESTLVLTYTNKKAIEYNTLIHQGLGHKEFFEEGGHYISNDVACNSDQKIVVGNEEHVFIDKILYERSFMGIDYIKVLLNKGREVPVPRDHAQYKKVLKEVAKAKDWKLYFKIKQSFVDLRHGYATTVHKAQGMTLDTVFVDLTDIGKCTVTDTLNRLLYVAVSRARECVYLTGSLPRRLYENSLYNRT